MIKKNIKKPPLNTHKIHRSGGWLFRGLVLVGIVVLFWISYSVFQQTYRQNQINKEIASLQEEIQRLHQDNYNLAELVQYLETVDFKEKEAKDKLNLIKDGESLLLVKEKEIAAPPSAPAQHAQPQVIVSRSNYYWWWHYYFSL